MKFDIFLSITILCLTIGVSSDQATAQDTVVTSLGGDMTTTLPGRHAIQLPAPNVLDRDRFEKQISGFDPFHRIVTPKEGLGKLFNNASCGGCHVENGKGPARFSRSSFGNSTMIVKVSLPGLNANGSPKDVPGVGEQLKDHAVSGKAQTSILLSWIPVQGRYGDGTKYVLRKPSLEFRLPNITQRKLVHSLRMSPALVGLGLLESIPESSIIGFSDPQDLNRDGISGKPQYVIERKSGELKLGRFGFKGSHPTIEEQSAAAAFNDIGVTTTLFPDQTVSVSELSDDTLDRLVFYQQVAGVPIARDQDSAAVQSGKQIFQEIGCTGCHIMTLRTEESKNVETSNQTIHPFTDLLLHDMGTGLADKRAEFAAGGNEWRTTPLWGLGAASGFSTVKPLYLHDGRARTIEEAILWHGGEGLAAKNKFALLQKKDRELLVLFLRSL